jgi:hypothetical protein
MIQSCPRRFFFSVYLPGGLSVLCAAKQDLVSYKRGMMEFEAIPKQNHPKGRKKAFELPRLARSDVLFVGKFKNRQPGDFRPRDVFATR